MKELVRMIKRAGKYNQLIWLRNEEQEIIKMGSLAVRTEKLKAEELGSLVSFFGEIPEEGIAISQHKDNSKGHAGHQITLQDTLYRIFENRPSGGQLIDTNILVIETGKVLRAFLDNDQYRYIDNGYMEILTEQIHKVTENKGISFREDMDDSGNERTLEFVIYFAEIEEQNPFLKEIL